ncbi:MAG TPA: response regulator [Gammaproteobacteria bacterium]|nr:response regulator [Gammaproteobacteria bacterium]
MTDDDRVDILVVDDLPDKLLAFQAVLEELGQNLVLVQSGADALRELLRREFAVVLLDVNMPDIDGIETAELIRQHSKTAHTPIIFVTAYADELQTARGYELGAVDYILSPIVPQILRSKVRVFVDLYRAQRRAQALARAEADRAAAEEATRRSELIARASRQLASSLDLEHGMRSFATTLVPGFAAHALLVVHGRERETRLLSCGMEGVRWLDSLELPARLRRAVDDVMASGRRVDIRLLSEAPSQWPADAPFVRVLPFMVGDRTVGAAALGAASHHLGDESTLLELVSRAAIAFDNAQLYSTLKFEMARSKEAEEKLQQANRRKDEFLAMLSHELRNPLAPIRSAAEIMRKIAPDDPRLTWAREVVERQVTHMAQIVDDLLDVSRITQGKVALQRQPVELAKVVFNSIETARPQLEAKQHQLSVNVPPAPIWVQGDFARLAQVFGNLLQNASKYTPDNGRIEISVSAERGSVVVSVRDNGIGIDPALLPHVFEPFTQGSRTLDRSQGGLGVGLAVVERLVALHDGRVEVSSDGIGRGAEFRVILPCISEVRQGVHATGVEQVVMHAPRKRVLVVDDNNDAAEAIAVFLRLEGHDVQTANDGPQALASAEIFAPEIAVVDIGLPGMDGYELARRLAARVPLLIALTGYGQSEDRQRSKAAGFRHHFVKPADPREITTVIRKYAMHPPVEHRRLVSDTEGV